MSALSILAGPKALAHIRQQGLKADDISAVFGASGAAKWLSIYGLDRAIFEQWMPTRTSPLHLFGTSIGAWKLAAAATDNPGLAMQQLAEAYIAQRYTRETTRQDVADEARRMLKAYLGEAQIRHILNHPTMHLHIGTIRSKGALSTDRKALLAIAMAQAALFNIGGRNALTGMMERVIFSQNPEHFPSHAGDAYDNEVLQLNAMNFNQALTASGSIPYVLPAVTDIPGARAGLYRDGGMLDYHPVPSMFSDFKGLILYPHFYPHLIPGWFDKPYKKRYARGTQIDNVILLAPNADFVSRLPYQRISDRKDFTRFEGNDNEREKTWRACMEASEQLGEEFLQRVRSGDIAAQVRAL